MKALFKQGSASTAVSAGGKASSTDDKLAAAKKAAREAAETKGCILAGQNWLMKVGDNLSPQGAMEVVRLVVDRVTEAADRQWMACVLMGDPNCKLDPWEVILGQSDVGGDQIAVISLALIARMMRLKGPGIISGSVGDLCTLIGYDTRKEVKAIEAAAKAAEVAVKGDGKEKLFTKSGLKSHKCERRQARKATAPAETMVDPAGGTPQPQQAEEPAQQLLDLVDKANFSISTADTDANLKSLPEISDEHVMKVIKVVTEPVAQQRGGKREKNGEAEAKAWAAYFDTRSIAKAANACGLDVESVKNWHKRRKWKGLVVYLETGSLTKVAEECAVTKAEAVKWHRDLKWEAIRQAHERAKEAK